MYAYTPTSLFPISSHQQQEQAIYARQQQEQQRHQQANMLFYQYNQLQQMQAAYSNRALMSPAYLQPSVEQNPQGYITDQLVPGSTPPTQAQNFIQQNQRSTPDSRLQIGSPEIWFHPDLLQNPTVFRPIINGLSGTKLDAGPYINPNNSMGNIDLKSVAVPSQETPKLTYQHGSKRHASSNSRRHHRRLNSASSDHGSEASDLITQNNNESELRPRSSKKLARMSPSSKKRSRSAVHADSSRSDPVINDTTHRLSIKNNELVPIRDDNVPTSNLNGSPKIHHSSLLRPKIVDYIEENVVGKNYIFQGPWGFRRMIYCDYTASGRPLHFIESYIKNIVLPLYGNTHSETSLCAQQSTRFREEARSIIKKSVNANDDDVLLFMGSGSTGAIHSLVDNFELHDENNRKNTVVIVSAFEHHSNILPWKEKNVEMVRIPTTERGLLDQVVLENYLRHYSKLKKRILCSLNAASNISGIITDVDAISSLVHSYSGLIFWDYATAAPYLDIDMNPSDTAYKDAIFISTHKMVGGPSTPGLLIAKKDLFSLKAPKTCGGGTVNFVTRTCHEYNYNIEVREEGGTPDVIGCIRAGLVFQLKDAIDKEYMRAREEELVKRFYRHFKKIKTLILLGSQLAPRLPIFSFLIYVPSVCKYLHHNFVCLLLNDLFGIQVRSGCACAGPYALDLLNVTDVKTDIYCLFMTEDIEARGNDHIVRTMIMKPGFTRINLSYFAHDDEIDFVLKAVQFVATEGWRFLPLYVYNPVTAGWKHRSGFKLAQMSLTDVTYQSGKMQRYNYDKNSRSSRTEKSLPDPFQEAKSIAVNAINHALATVDYKADPPLNVPEKYKHMVWFALPIDIVSMMTKQANVPDKPMCTVDSIPFMPEEAKERFANSTKFDDARNGSDHKKKPNSHRTSSSIHKR